MGPRVRRLSDVVRIWSEIQEHCIGGCIFQAALDSTNNDNFHLLKNFDALLQALWIPIIRINTFPWTNAHSRATMSDTPTSFPVLCHRLATGSGGCTRCSTRSGRLAWCSCCRCSARDGRLWNIISLCILPSTRLVTDDDQTERINLQ